MSSLRIKLSLTGLIVDSLATIQGEEPEDTKDTPPVEPPIIDARDAKGFEDSEITIYMSAKVTNGTPFDSFKIYLMNFPENSTFSFGHLFDYRWELDFSDFGNISFMPPRDISGNFTFHVLAEMVHGSRNSTRNNFISVLIEPIIDGVDMRVRVDCFSMENNYANLHLNAPLKDTDSSETLEVSITVPENFNLSLGQETDIGTFVLSSMDILNAIEVFGENMSEVDQFNITIVAIVVENGTWLQKSYRDIVVVEKCTDLKTSTMSVSTGQGIVSSTTCSAATSVASTEDSTESGTSQVSKLWIAVISVGAAVIGFIVIVTTVYLIRKKLTKHKTEQTLVQEDSQKLMDMTTVRMYRPKLLSELSSYENPVAAPTQF